MRAATRVPTGGATFRRWDPRPLTRVRLPAVAVGVLLGLVVAVLLAVSFAVEGPADPNSGAPGNIGTTVNTTKGNPTKGNPTSLNSNAGPPAAR